MADHSADCEAAKVKPTSTKHSASETSTVTNGVAAMKLDGDTKPTPQNRNLDVLHEFEKSNVKNSVNFVVIGKYLLEISKDRNAKKVYRPR